LRCRQNTGGADLRVSNLLQQERSDDIVRQ
jgi:hypothetical protein